MIDAKFLLDHLSGIGLWVVIAVVLFAFVGSRLAETVDGFAKALGPLGRHWRKQAAKRREERRGEMRAEIRAQMSEIKPPDYEQLKRDLNRVLERVQDMESTEEVNQAYLIHDAQWHFEVDQYLAEHGVSIPKRVAYREFARRYRAGERLNDSGEWETTASPRSG